MISHGIILLTNAHKKSLLATKDTITLVKRVSIISRSLYSNSVPLCVIHQWKFMLLNLESYTLHLSIADVLLSLWKHTYFGRKSSSILCPTPRSITARSETCAACPIAPILIGNSMKGSSTYVYSSVK